MIIVRLKGGLGNQMFQYAFAKAYSIKNNTRFQLDLRYLNDRFPRRKGFSYRTYDLDIFKTKIEIFKKTKYLPFQIYLELFKEKIQRILINTFNISSKRVFNEHEFSYKEHLLSLPDETYFNGYFQGYKYFDDIKDLLIQDFCFRIPINQPALEQLHIIKNCESVCVHIRRGDFLKDKVLGVFSKEYFDNSINLISKKLLNPHFFIFSDDIIWCKENIKCNNLISYMGNEYNGIKNRDCFELMMNCKNFIISNSTFSWWAAYLCQSKKKIIIAPSKWLKDSQMNSKYMDSLLPKSWILN